MMNRRGGRWLHYDRAGEPIEWERWAELLEQGIGTPDEYRRVGATEVGEARISTVWLGIDHNFFGDGPPIIYETMVFGGEHDQAQMRYCTEAEAVEGHLKTVEDVRAGKPVLWFEAEVNDRA